MTKMSLAVMLIVVMCALPALARARPAPEGDSARLTEPERDKAIELLLRSQKEFLDAVENLSDAQWSYKPAPERWSVAEVAEHLMLAEASFFATVEGTLAQKPDPGWQSRTAGKTEFLERALLNRQVKAQAPEPLQPRRDLTRAEILSRFKNARARTLKFIKETNVPLKAYTRDHPFPIFGTLNAYQWLIYIPLHNLRHNQQIAEVKSTPGFPG